MQACSGRKVEKLHDTLRDGPDSAMEENTPEKLRDTLRDASDIVYKFLRQSSSYLCCWGFLLRQRTHCILQVCLLNCCLLRLSHVFQTEARA